MEFSVLMSVYKNDRDIYFDKALESVLIKQSLIPSELVIVQDGPLTKELEDIIKKYQKDFREKIKLIRLNKNLGLGEALRIGLNSCDFEYIARMDSDDISEYYRFEKQIKTLTSNAEVDLVGGNIAEFFEDIKEVKFIRKVPNSRNDIKKMAKRRNPINHVSVMFKKSAVLSAGSYQHMLFLEDYYLWVRMLDKKFNLINLNEVLVYVRTGESMFRRRSNFVYIKSWFQLQKSMVHSKFINYGDFFINMINITVFTFIPSKMKKHIYKWFLRSNIIEHN
ncbi:glycosyltransferase involved in cell wall biosynthesis [Planomicrobium sp. HSC-17F08]|nr:glycosyltransferase involved in cell wall biosynthesis [Planomicrobium sp. HSC-17F08]